MLILEKAERLKAALNDAKRELAVLKERREHLTEYIFLLEAEMRELDDDLRKLKEEKQ